MSTRILYTDGSIAGGNPGGWAVGGWVCKTADGERVHAGTLDLGKGPDRTNNQAEYAGILSGIRWLFDSGWEGAVIVRADSQLCVNQLAGRWRCKNPALAVMHEEILQLGGEFASISFEWIPRKDNAEADAQSRTLYPSR